MAGNLLNLSTLAGLAVSSVGGCSLRPGPYGLLLAEGYRFGFPTGGAFTVGDVVITARSIADLQRSFPRLLEHEERHSWQYLVCLGLPFLIAYAVALGYSVLRTGDRAARNVFERHAGLEAGGYQDLPVIPMSVQVRRARAWFRRFPPRDRRRFHPLRFSRWCRFAHTQPDTGHTRGPVRRPRGGAVDGDDQAVSLWMRTTCES